MDTNTLPEATKPPAELAPTPESAAQNIVTILTGYRDEAVTARESGPAPRDSIWSGNWDRYWGRYDHSKKAPWQSRHVLPEVPQYVDRWAAAMREALDTITDWFDVMDEGRDSELVPHIRKVMEVLLGRCSRTPDGHVADFSSLFEEQMKQGCITAICTATTWKGYVSVESVDAREYWGDPKIRNLYRRRVMELDKYELRAMAREKDSAGNSLYKTEVIDSLMAEIDGKARNEKEQSTGHGQGGETGRTPIKYEEWLCNIVDDQGELIHENALVVIANDTFLIRGPEANPFQHKKDWIVFTPMVTVPLSFYGRSYMEDWSSVADAFIELSNLILDGVFTSATKIFIANPSKLDDSSQLDEGISPNKLFIVGEDTAKLEDFMRTVDLGTLPPEAIMVWDRLKNELREGAKLSEIALGQMAPHARTTKAEIQQVQQSGSSMVRSMARTIETRWLEPTLTLMWKTALQHMDFMTIKEAIGEDAAAMFNSRRAEFIDHPFSFRVRGISGAIDRQAKLQALMQALTVISNNQMLAGVLGESMAPAKLLEVMFTLFGVDRNQFKLTEKERLIQEITQAQQPQQQGAPGGQPPTPQPPSPAA